MAAIAGLPVDRAPRYMPAIACEVASRILGRPVHTGTGSLHYAETCALMQGEEAHREFESRLFEDLAESQLGVRRRQLFQLRQHLGGMLRCPRQSGIAQGFKRGSGNLKCRALGGVSQGPTSGARSPQEKGGAVVRVAPAPSPVGGAL